MRPSNIARPPDNLLLRTFRLAVILLAATLAGCTDDGSGGAAQQEELTQELPKLNVIEPTGQRSPYGNFLAGRFAERQRDFGRAATALLRALEENPDDLMLMRRTFFLTLEAGRMAKAVQLARRLEAAGTKFSSVQLLLVAEAIKNKDYPGALRRLESMDQEDLSRYSVPMAMAWARAGGGDPDRALAALSSLDSDSGFALLRNLHEGFINDIAGRVAEADAAYRAALGDDPKTAPNRVMRAYGNYLERRGRRDEAGALYSSYGGQDADSLLFEDALKRVADSGTPEPLIGDAAEGLAESLFDIASILPKDRAGEFVLIYTRMALYLRPDFPLAQLLMGDVFDEFGKYREAAEIYRSVDPKSAYGWVARLRLSDDLYDMGDIDEAVGLLRRMGGERPERSDALVRLGNMLRYEGRYGESVVAYDKAVERLGETRRDDWALFYNRGISLAESGNWERAEKDFLRALELQPDQPFVLNYLGYSWVERGMNLERAREMLERAVAQREDNGYIVDSMGWALYKLGEFEEAVTYLERAVALLPQDAEINDHLGDAYWRVGRFGEARIQWNRVLGLDPEEDLVKQIQDKLRDGLPPHDKAGGDG